MANTTVLDQHVGINKDDYISITDIAKYKDDNEANDIIRNWLRNRNTIEFLGILEQLYNPDFKPVEFDGFRKEAGLNSFTMSPKTNQLPLLLLFSKNGDSFTGAY